MVDMRIGRPLPFDESLGARRLEIVGHQRRTVLDQAELGGGAAHIEGEQPVVAVVTAEPSGRQGAGRRPRFQQPDRHALGFVRGSEAAIGQHQMQGRADSAVGQAGPQLAKIVFGKRFDIGVGDRGRGALEFADLRRHLDGTRNRECRETLGEAQGGFILMDRVGVGMQKHHRDRLDAVGH